TNAARAIDCPSGPTTGGRSGFRVHPARSNDGNTIPMRVEDGCLNTVISLDGNERRGSPGGENPADFERPPHPTLPPVGEGASRAEAQSNVFFGFPSMRFARFAMMSFGSFAPPPPPWGRASDRSSGTSRTDPSAKTNCVPRWCRLEKFHLSLLPRFGLYSEPPVRVHMVAPSFPATYTPVQTAPQ